MPNPTVRHRFGDLIYEIDDRSERVISRWPDGVTLTALPNYDEESTARAEALGYGTHANPVWAMTRDHDAVHHLVARALGAPWSEHLRAVALGKPSPDGDGEERLVLLVQRAMTSGGSLSRLAGARHPTMRRA